MLVPVFAALVVATVSAAALIALPAERVSSNTTAATSRNPLLLEKAGASGVTVEAFIDFECEGCGGMYLELEEIRAEFSDRVTIILRQYPQRAHVNAMNAARAIEAADDQGRLESMYQRLLESQEEWAGTRRSEASLFRTYAAELGLDVARYDAAVASDVTSMNIQSDVARGDAMGVVEVPAFFVGEIAVHPQTASGLRAAILSELSK